MSAPRGLPHTWNPPQCDLCRQTLGTVAAEFNDGFFCVACAWWAYESLDCDGDLTLSRPRRIYRKDPLVPFLERLGDAAAQQGINRQALATAVSRARR